MAEVKYVDGNVNSSVLVHGEDPTNADNVLVTPLSGTVSVAKDSLTDVNEHDLSQLPEGDVKDAEIASLKQQLEGGDSKDAEIAALKQQLADAEGNG